ncbi:MAG: UvrB/UvrC motif-containing protein [Oscillospiraceae bacterium]|jgi:protein arginine kinase activator|nr:UvrB/UvrC motif-containing protein [Oscillospiraceae bacterium]
MKCQNCGKNEASFFQRININGNVTETHLCSECAEKLGYLDARGFTAKSLFDGFFDEPAGVSGFFDAFPAAGARMPGPYNMPRAYMPGHGAAPEAARAAAAEAIPPADAELSRLREINLLRERMRAAAAKEDFEQAMQIREEIKELEGQRL